MSHLDSLIMYAELFQKLTPLDCCVMVADTEGRIVRFIQARSFSMDIHEGSIASSKGSVIECLQTGREIQKVVPKEVYGVTVKAISVPIIDDNRVVGVIATATSLVAQETLQAAAQNIAATSEQITATTQEVASAASMLATNLENLRKSGEGVIKEVGKTDAILSFVSEVAANSNLLGLNAAIEAARAGEQGRGFAVVADEIRKMADNSSKSVKDISAILKKIQGEVTGIVRTLGDTSQLGERQAAATQQISASMQQLAASAEHIEKIAEIV
ncbi:hypothetical protein GJ688_06345 [Heliobacillus mobilis]|uniref:Methyl-accepting transducer domain-containing protein n=1 Tax=Heliobacterium mobile TaxID=28064 RepID=A0A6I3SIL7_HELMO|nr:methyl-accepting chemotaxis protein [Heliobacterium mobile]MTV48602.1 hypothetical protein [Heliobacterium mobile]